MEIAYLCGVGLCEQVIQSLDLLLSLSDVLASESQLFCDVLCVFLGDSGLDIDWSLL